MAVAESSWPSPSYNSGAVSSAEFEAMNFYVGGGLLGLYSETSAIFADSSGRQVKIRAGRYGLIHGYHWYSGTSDVTVAIAANSSGSTRVDRVVLRLTRATWQVRVAVIAGTPGAGAPAYTQTYSDSGVFEISLALVTVANNAASLAAGDVVFHAPYFAPTPMIAPTAGVTPLTANNTARSYVGQTYLDIATGALRYHNGTALRQLADGGTLGNSFDPTIYRPIVKLIMPADLSIPNTTNTAVSWGNNSELIDTHNFHSTTTNTSRITPTVPGYYDCRFTPAWAQNSSGARQHQIGKNGVGQAPAIRWVFGQPNQTIVLPTAHAIISCNGTTDYIEAFASQTSGGALNLVGNGDVTQPYTTIFEVSYLRPL